jgi:hypothetical protein
MRRAGYRLGAGDTDKHFWTLRRLKKRKEQKKKKEGLSRTVGSGA